MKHELLVPVGNYEALVQAINNGADAVYLGGKKFGARKFANNFTIKELEEATKLCHLYGVKIYVTVNTLIYEDEVKDALEYIKTLHKLGIDAVIMQDIGLINLVHKTLPNLEIHASTQMHNHSEESLNFLKSLGIKRVVFARELSLNYINNIKTDLEKEVFIHGSLCISYSGQCLFSSFILNRSGNRGECAGMCRLPYKLVKDNKEIDAGGDYILSPKDLSSLDNFKELLDSNIKCFKIEGRMKSPEYVGLVTKIYRNLINQYENNEELKVNEEDFTNLKAVFNREYTKGFLFNDKNIMNFQHPNHMGLHLGEVVSFNKKKICIKLDRELKQFEGIRFKNSDIGINVNFIYNKFDKLVNKGMKNELIYIDNFINLTKLDEVLLTNPIIELEKTITKKIKVNMKLVAHINEPLVLEVNDNEFSIIEKSSIVDKSLTSPISKERIKEVLSKTGNTPFILNNIEIDMDKNIFIRIGELNALRRNILEKLQKLRENNCINYIENKYVEEEKQYDITNKVSVLVRTKEQLDTCLNLGIKDIIVNNKELMKDEYTYKIPRDNLNHNYEYQKLLITDYASLDKYRNNHADYYLNVVNHYSLNKVLEYAKLVTLSPECSFDNIKNILNNYQNKPNVEVLIYGNIELMLMKYCPLKTILNKDKICKVCLSDSKFYLKDRFNKLYKIDTNNALHSTTIFNHSATDYIEEIPNYKKIGVTNFRIEFLDEDKYEVRKIIERVKKYI